MGVPTKVISSSIPFQDGAGNVVANGTLRLQLTQNATVTSGGGQVTTEPIFFLLDANGKIPANSVCWFNDELTPSGTAYHATLVAKNGCRTLVDYGNWVLSGASVDVSTIAASTTTVSYANAVLTNPPSGALQTIAGPLNAKTIENVRFADQFSGADMAAKIAAAIADLSSGGIVDARAFNGAQAWATNPFASTTVPITLLMDQVTVTVSTTISIPSFVNIIGSGTGSTSSSGTRLIAASGSVSPIVKYSGASAGTRVVVCSIRNLTISGVYTVAQIGMQFDHVSEIILDNVQFLECGQAEDINDAYEILHHACTWTNCGSGDTAATAVVRIENRSNASVPTEQIKFSDGCLWQGDQAGFTKNGIGVYCGPAVTQFSMIGCKMDFTNSAMAARVLVLDQCALAVVEGNWIASGSTAHPPTGSSVIALPGSVGTKTTRCLIVGNYILDWTSTFGISADRATGNIFSENVFEGSGTGTHINLTANCQEAVAGPNYSYTADTMLANAAIQNIALSMKNDTTRSWWFRDRISIGATPAVTGDISIGNLKALTARNAANSADINLIYLDGSDKVNTGAATIVPTSLTTGTVFATVVSQAPRFKANVGSALVTGDVGSISGGWGTTATCSAVTGRDQAGTISMSSTGTGQGANPTFVLTFHDGTWSTAPIITATRTENGAPSGGIVASTTATAATFTFLGTPVAGTTYTISFICMGV